MGSRLLRDVQVWKLSGETKGYPASRPRWNSERGVAVDRPLTFPDGWDVVMTEALLLLAQALGEPVERIRETLGASWSRYPEDFGSIESMGPSGERADDPMVIPGASTFATGEPLDAFITVVPEVVAFVFNPAGQWADPGTLVYVASRPGPPVPLGAPDTIEHLAVRLKRVQRSARASLRRCKNCHQRTRPELWFGDGYCQACASTELGVAF